MEKISAKELYVQQVGNHVRTLMNDNEAAYSSIEENEKQIAHLERENKLKQERIELNKQAIKLAEETLNDYLEQNP